MPFINKLQKILDDPLSRCIIEWKSQKTVIHIQNPQKFQLQILPLYFRHNKLTSFIKQLYNYGFYKKRGKQYYYTHNVLKTEKSLKNITAEKKILQNDGEFRGNTNNQRNQIMIQDINQRVFQYSSILLNRNHNFSLHNTLQICQNSVHNSYFYQIQNQMNMHNNNMIPLMFYSNSYQ